MTHLLEGMMSAVAEMSLLKVTSIFAEMRASSEATRAEARFVALFVGCPVEQWHAPHVRFVLAIQSGLLALTRISGELLCSYFDSARA
jgi:hypothetical protein